MTSTINTPHTATVAGGTYTENIGKTTIKTFCNDPNGYALYAIGYTDNTYGATTLKGATTENNIATGTYTSDTTTNSVWSMKLNSVSGTYAPTIENSFNNYSQIPSNFTKVATYTNNTDIEVSGSGTGSSVETTYAAYISSTQAADTYTGQVKYVLVHPNTTVAGLYNIAYNANGGTGVTTGHTGVYNFEPVTLAENGFSRSGYSFVGWCTTNTSGTSCLDGTLYQPGGTATSLGSANSTVTLYAIWGKLPTLDQISNMQDDFSCAATVTGTTNTLTDTRDGSTYTVAKLADGNCWMTQNLRIAHSTGQPEGTILAIGSNFNSKEKVELTDGTSFNDYGTPQYHTPTETDLSQSNLTADQVGAWYSFCAASAKDTENHGCDNSASYTGSEDICPAGWHLPTNSESDSLRTALNADSAAKVVFSPVYGGYYYSGSLNNAATCGFWWSSTAYNASSQYSLYYLGGSLDTGNLNKSLGLYIRCMRSGA